MKVSGLPFAGDFTGMSDAQEGPLKKPNDAAMKFARNHRLTSRSSKYCEKRFATKSRILMEPVEVT